MSTDLLEREIFRYAAQSISQELEINITRTAYSPLIRISGDYCVALMTPDFKPFVQSENAIPIFVTDMGEPIRDAVSVIGEEALAPGDVFCINYGSGQHLNNVVVGTPLYHGEQITGYLAIRSHWADVGGLIPGGQSMSSRSVFHEGTRYRGLRIMRRGEIVPEVLETIRVNTYQPEMLIGDLMAQLAACQLGARRWNERIVSRWSAPQVEAITRAQLEASTEHARRSIAEIPDGRYRAEHPWRFKHQGIEHDLLFKLELFVDGDRMTVDLSGMPPQSELPINCGAKGGGEAAVRLAFRYLVRGDYPTDQGLFDPLEVILPPGTILSATGDAPLGFWNLALPLTIDLFLRAIGQAHPELVPASHFATLGAVVVSGKRADGKVWSALDGGNGGLGAERGADGYGPTKSLFGNTKSVPLEVVEASFPLRFHSYGVWRGSGGPGRYTGGPGSERIWEVLTPARVVAYPQPSAPAPGLAGGLPGALGSTQVLADGASDWVDIEEYFLTRTQLAPGDVVRQRTGGGGGWGEPADDRTPKDEQ